MSTAEVSSRTPLHCETLASHPHTPNRLQLSTSTPRCSAVARTPASVGQPLTPLQALEPRSPAGHVQDGRSPSPNYFGFMVESSKDVESSGGGIHTRANWSPPNSNVRSTAAASPRVMALDQNPEFEAFRRQSETHGFDSNALTGMKLMTPGPIRTSARSRVDDVHITPSSLPNTQSFPFGQVEHRYVEAKPKSPKRLLSSPYPPVTDRPRRGSPASFTDREVRNAPPALQFFRREEGDDVRLSLPSKTGSTPASSPPAPQARADTLPAVVGNECSSGESKDGPNFTSPSHVATLLGASSEEILLLDLRISTLYARSRIAGALNLCIPTTLLKRPSYNTHKLSDTFKSDEQRHKFESWQSCKYIIVYDGSSSRPKDALSCLNTLKKFTAEGWAGQAYIIRGGFVDFSNKFPKFVTIGLELDSDSGSQSQESGGESRRPSLLPVIGGCPLPATNNPANPFFGNIRQNMDLIGGVGQMSIKLPNSMTKQQEEQLPQWLRVTTNYQDNGKVVSERFLEIEKREQKRMQEALSGNVTYVGGSSVPQTARPVQIAGIEQGAKNRYNNIWPYEHSRVKLQCKQEGSCDYVNANHVRACWSNKRYIATQGPIPATFSDFWNVVWQQDVRVIVMLTAEKEAGQVKAHNYWSERRYGPLHLNYLSEHRASLEPSKIHRYRENHPGMGRRRSTNPQFGRVAVQPEVESPSSEQPYVIVRRFTLSSEDEPFARMREITQLQYSSWPDFGAPAHPAHLLGLVEQCDAVVRTTRAGSSSGPAPEDSRPVLVHCSAGCGRTGTFCTVDTVIDMLKRQRADAGRLTRQFTPMDVDMTSPFGTSFEYDTGPPSLGDKGWVDSDDVDLIEKTVEDFRLQRLSMVQSLKQFVLCYETILEWMTEQTPKSA